MADKFIPGGEAAFAQKARNFAKAIGGDPQRFGVGREDADVLVRAVEEFEKLRLSASNKSSRSKNLFDQRDAARRAAIAGGRSGVSSDNLKLIPSSDA